MSTLIFFLMGVAHASDLADAIREQTQEMQFPEAVSDWLKVDSMGEHDHHAIIPDEKRETT